MSRSLADDERRRAALKREAHAVQQHLLPRAVDIPGLQTATLFLAAEGVAGDYYDFLPLGDGTWVICIADVMGHGVPAAMPDRPEKGKPAERRGRKVSGLKGIGPMIAGLPGDAVESFLLPAMMR